MSLSRGQDHSDLPVRFNGKVDECVFQGETAFALVSISDQHQVALRFGTSAVIRQNNLRPGDDICLGLHENDVVVIPVAG